jgi:uncharacterized membrane protein
MKTPVEKRPHLKPILTRTDYILETAVIIGFLASWIIPSVIYQYLPDTIPTHFGIRGKADAWGSKSNLFLLPAISTVLVIGLSILNKFPHIFNYPVKVTEENALQLYTKGTRLIRICKMCIAFLFLFIEWQICNSINNASLPVWFLPVVLLIPVLLPVIMAFTLTRSSSPGKPVQ